MSDTSLRLGKSFGTQLRHIREKQGYTREQLADRVGISVRYVASMELNNRLPSMEVILLLVQALGCTTDDLLMPESATAKSSADHVKLLYEQCSERDQQLILAMLNKMLDIH